MVAQGIDYLADTLASEFAMNAAGAGLLDVNLYVSQIDTLDAYAGSQSYLDSLLLVDALDVARVDGQTVEYRATLRGGIDELTRALRLDARMRVLDQPRSLARGRQAGTDTPAPAGQSIEKTVTVPQDVSESRPNRLARPPSLYLEYISK